MIISLMFLYLCKVIFSGFLQLKGDFVDGQNNSKYRECASGNRFVSLTPVHAKVSSQIND